MNPVNTPCYLPTVLVEYYAAVEEEDAYMLPIHIFHFSGLGDLTPVPGSSMEKQMWTMHANNLCTHVKTVHISRRRYHALIEPERWFEPRNVNGVDAILNDYVEYVFRQV